MKYFCTDGFCKDDGDRDSRIIRRHFCQVNFGCENRGNAIPAPVILVDWHRLHLMPTMTATTQRPRIYIETSIISYLTARDSASLLGAARQLLTRRWWESRKSYDIFISDIVLRECRAGDPLAATRRLESLKGIDSLSVTPSVIEVAESLLDNKVVPAKAAEDALHIAVATVHNMDFLLTWNCKHIANPIIQANVAVHLNKAGLLLPFICTPEELSGEDYAR